MQPYFLPYVGYWQMMAAVDEFIVLDDVNFIKGGWINRNRILSFGKIQWLTVPLKGASPNKSIREVGTNLDDKAKRKISKSIEGAYGKAPCYKIGKSLWDEIIHFESDNLAEFVTHSLIVIGKYLELHCKIVPTTTIFENQELKGKDRVIDICQRVDATRYVNVLAGRDLYKTDEFTSQGIELRFIEPKISPYGETFEPGLSILDIIMMNPPETTRQFVSQGELVP